MDIDSKEIYMLIYSDQIQKLVIVYLSLSPTQ